MKPAMVYQAERKKNSENGGKHAKTKEIAGYLGSLQYAELF
jgi:hypothetical protein